MIVWGDAEIHVFSFEAESCVACFEAHPQKGTIRQTGIDIAAADVAVNAGEPDLLHFLAWGYVLGEPQRWSERVAAFINRKRVVGVLDMAAEGCVVKAELVLAHVSE